MREFEWVQTCYKTLRKMEITDYTVRSNNIINYSKCKTLGKIIKAFI